MIQKLRRDLLTAAMVSLGSVFAVIVLAANLFNYGNMAKEADALLTMLAENGGTFPHWESQAMQDLLTQSPEVLFTCRYFSVSMADAETITAANTEKISAVDETGAAEYAKAVWSQEKGFYRNFRFIRWNGGEETLFVFMDCEKDLLSFYSFMGTSILIASLRLLSVFILLLILSGRIVKPVAESYEKQKRFITDAGHEIKTPLTIISADADVLDMECGENEWLRDIQLQIKRLTSLTNDLIYLSKMEEAQGHLQLYECCHEMSTGSAGVDHLNTIRLSLQPEYWALIDYLSEKGILNEREFAEYLGKHFKAQIAVAERVAPKQNTD